MTAKLSLHRYHRKLNWDQSLMVRLFISCVAPAFEYNYISHACLYKSITPSKTNTVVRIIDHKLLYKNYLSAVCVHAAAEKFSLIARYMTSLDIVLVMCETILGPIVFDNHVQNLRIM